MAPEQTPKELPFSPRPFARLCSQKPLKGAKIAGQALIKLVQANAGNKEKQISSIHMHKDSYLTMKGKICTIG